MKTEIYIATHKKADILTKISEQHKEYIPIHVGKILSSEYLGFIGDDTGENISHLNPNFCELTALYWMWKNSTADILGLVHYRRYFISQQQIINQHYFNYQQLKNSIIIAKKELFFKRINHTLDNTTQHNTTQHNTTQHNTTQHNTTQHNTTHYITIEEQYVQHCYQHDWNQLRIVIQEFYPYYLQSFDEIANSIDGLSPYNMFIGDAVIVKAYCEWLFDILFKLQERLDIKYYDDYQKRVYGFLAERLFNVYLYHHRLQINIIECPVIFIDLK